jgi:hypothetical protein
VIGCLVLLVGLGGCHLYKESVQPVQNEILVKLVADPAADYSHPVQWNAADLSAILEDVQVEYKAGWLQKLITGPLKPLPLFTPETLPAVVAPLVRAFAQATPRDRIVFYIAERRSDIRREVTAGSLFMTGPLIHVVVNNHRTGVDVVPGVPAYDQRNPEIAVSPQRYMVVFDRPEFQVEPQPTFIEKMFDAAPPQLAVDYRLFLNLVRPRNSPKKTSQTVTCLVLAQPVDEQSRLRLFDPGRCKRLLLKIS